MTSLLLARPFRQRDGRGPAWVLRDQLLPTLASCASAGPAPAAGSPAGPAAAGAAVLHLPAQDGTPVAAPQWQPPVPKRRRGPSAAAGHRQRPGWITTATAAGASHPGM